MGSESEQPSAARNMAKPGSVSRLGRDMGPEPPHVSKGPLLHRPSLEHRAAPPGTTNPAQPASSMPRLVFRESAYPDEECVISWLLHWHGGHIGSDAVPATCFS